MKTTFIDLLREAHEAIRKADGAMDEAAANYPAEWLEIEPSIIKAGAGGTFDLACCLNGFIEKFEREDA